MKKERPTLGDHSSVDKDFFSMTFLGRCGWLFSSCDNHILFDPLFFDEFGSGPKGFRYPAPSTARQFDLSKLPRIDAVFLTHEHEDHFDIPSLHCLPRDTAIYLPENSSSSAFTILSELGFKSVHRWRAGALIQYGSLNVRGLLSDHLSADHLDEWDVMPYLVWHEAGHGKFFNEVDVIFTFPMLTALWKTTAEIDASVPLDASVNRYFLFGQAVDKGGRPSSALKWGFPPRPYSPRPWTEPEPQPRSVGQIKKALGEEKTLFLRPGLTFRLEEGDLAEIRLEVPFLQCMEKPLLAARFEGANKNISEDNMQELKAGEWRELEGHLSEYARYLYGRVLFKSLLSLAPEALEKRKRAFIFLLHDGDKSSVPRIYAFSTGEPTFFPAEGVGDDYVVGCECHARNLLEVFRGEYEPRILTIWRSRWWGLSELRNNSPVTNEFVSYFHPLRHPQSVLERYRKRVREL